MTDFDDDYDGDRQDGLTLTDSKGLILADYAIATNFCVDLNYHSDLDHASGMSCEKNLKDLIGIDYHNDFTGDFNGQ